MRFNASKTSTVEGYNAMNEGRLETFKAKGIDIPKGHEDEFFDYLSSMQFKKMGAVEDSNQVAKAFNKARKAGHDAMEIVKGFNEVLNNNLSLDQVEEKLHIAEWQNGGLLK
jgi:hypothetical protein